MRISSDFGSAPLFAAILGTVPVLVPASVPAYQTRTFKPHRFSTIQTQPKRRGVLKVVPTVWSRRAGSEGTTRCLFIKHRSSVPRCNPCRRSHFMGDG